jgi:LysM repeat protein
VLPTHEDRIADLEARVQRLELQVGMLQGNIVVQDGQYQLRAGDSGAKIAFMFGISLADLNSMNPGQNWTKLKVGQFIRVSPKSGPNQSTDPTLASGTPAAEQPARHP